MIEVDLSDRLVGRIAIEALGGWIPARNDGIERLHHDGLVG